MIDAASGSAHRPADRAFLFFIALISGAVLAFLTYILAIRTRSGVGSGDLAFLPVVNAALNALSATCLILGYSFIRRRRILQHKISMIAALVFSVLFFISYSVYHYVHGDTKFLGQGISRGVYFTILSSHIVLSAVIVPLVLITVFFAGTRRFARHKKIARITLPLWLYVSVTGVIVFFMLRDAAS